MCTSAEVARKFKPTATSFGNLGMLVEDVSQKAARKTDLVERCFQVKDIEMALH